ncbi:protein-L-isoaspartate(D-aspartate) O-methyltransferase [Mesorhizobium sp. Z1-4]|uniref:protein-L-isoaspartate(D-aspartate) O-methyltransferase n=1 Tax=Mesorhizobium sp. Z1-4 TaxID=2448478 RepID=UPI000FDAF372|nr:protein-L-isoaspartate(D-aspartate) O-methyltransferase [Mesorhizobium sp. Z1-4]
MNGAQAGKEGFVAFLMRMRALGLDNKKLLGAIEATPRADFVSGPWHDAIWQDRVLPIACGEVIEGIDLQAQVLAALDIDDGHRVLEIGTGSGFTAAVMSRIAGRVLTYDRFKRLRDEAQQRFQALGLNNVIARQGDASNGAASEGPFDRIVVWAAFESLPRGFVDQLATGGVMVAAIGDGEGEQPLTKLTKLGSRFERQDLRMVRFQPLGEGVAAVL